MSESLFKFKLGCNAQYDKSFLYLEFLIFLRDKAKPTISIWNLGSV